MGGIGYSIFAASGLISLGVYSLVAAINSYLQPSPISNNGERKPYGAISVFQSHGESSSGRGIWWSIKQRAAIYVVVLWLVIAFLHDLVSAADFDPLFKGHTPVHRFTLLRSSSILLLFLVLSLSVIFIPSLDSRLFYSILSASFYLESTSSQSSDIQGHLNSVSHRVFALSSLLSLALAVNPKLFAFEVGLWGSVVLQGFWNLQTGLSLYVDSFTPEGCHRLLDVPSGVDGSTKCDLEDSLLRAIAIIDFLFVLYVLVVLLIVTIVYGILSKGCGGLRSRVASYDALPPSDSNVQMKTLAGTQA